MAEEMDKEKRRLQKIAEEQEAERLRIQREAEKIMQQEKNNNRSESLLR